MFEYFIETEIKMNFQLRKIIEMLLRHNYMVLNFKKSEHLHTESLFNTVDNIKVTINNTFMEKFGQYYSELK